MRGVRDYIFSVLVRNPRTTGDEFVTKATKINEALADRARHCLRRGDAATLALPHAELSTGGDYLRDNIQEIVREELQKLPPAAGHPASLSIVDTLFEELQRVL